MFQCELAESGVHIKSGVFGGTRGNGRPAGSDRGNTLLIGCRGKILIELSCESAAFN